MAKFIIEPHFRLQEWIAEEKGYFAAEGLDYEFRELVRSTGGQHHDKGGERVGAYQPVVQGRVAVPAPGAAGRRRGSGGVIVQRPLLFCRAARLPQGHRHDLHDRDDDPRRSRPRGFAQALPRVAPRPA